MRRTSKKQSKRAPSRTTPRRSALDLLRSDHRVELVDDERKIGNSVIVTLNWGWRFNDEGEHVFGEDTPSEALRSLRERVRPCSCQECRKNLAKK